MMSGDDGATWTRASVRVVMHSDAIVKCLLADTRRPGVVYAGTDLGRYRTADSGARWSVLDTPLTGAMVWSVALDPADSNVLFAGSGTPSKPGLFRTIDGGEMWEQLTVEIAAE
jgi:hypothetical protein